MTCYLLISLCSSPQPVAIAIANASVLIRRIEPSFAAERRRDLAHYVTPQDDGRTNYHRPIAPGKSVITVSDHRHVAAAVAVLPDSATEVVLLGCRVDVDLAALPKRVTIYEVGPRDGLQNESVHVATDDKVAFVVTNVLHHIEGDGVLQIKRSEVHDILDAVFGNIIEKPINGASVGINKSESLTVAEILNRHVLEQS